MATLPPEEQDRAPPAAETQLQQARTLADQGRLDEAQRQCEATVSRDRLIPEAHLLLAAIHQEKGESHAALDALRRALYLAPDFASAHFLMGTLLLRQGKRRQGVRCLETVVRLLSSTPRDEAVVGGDGLTAGRLFDLTGQGVAEGSTVVVLDTGGMTFGIHTDGIAGTLQIGSHEVAPPPATLTGGRQAFIRGVTKEMIAVLDILALIQDPRIVVNDEVT